MCIYIIVEGKSKAKNIIVTINKKSYNNEIKNIKNITNIIAFYDSCTGFCSFFNTSSFSISEKNKLLCKSFFNFVVECKIEEQCVPTSGKLFIFTLQDIKNIFTCECEKTFLKNAIINSN